MAWKERTVMTLKVDFAQKALHEEYSMTQLCKEFSISRKTGYKWLHRFKEHGIE